MNPAPTPADLAHTSDRITPERRLDNYRRQNGTGRLTPRQRRRAAKKSRGVRGWANGVEITKYVR